MPSNGFRTKLNPRYSEAFGLVVTSHGVLPWLPDLQVWAEQIVGCLVTGGQLYLSDSHPMVWDLAEDGHYRRPASLDGQLPLTSTLRAKKT